MFGAGGVTIAGSSGSTSTSSSTPGWAVYLPEHRDLFGISWNGFRQASTVLSVKAILTPLAMKPVDQVIPQLRRFVDDNAFGAPRRKVSPGPT